MDHTMIDRGNYDRPVLWGTPEGLFSLRTVTPGEKLSSDWTHVSPAVATAYEVCLEAEEELMHQQTVILTATETKALEKKLVNIRVLGYLLMFGPTDAARENIAKMTLTDKGESPDALVDWRGFYDHFFLRTCKVSPSRALV